MGIPMTSLLHEWYGYLGKNLILCSQESDCFKIYWMGFVHMFIFLFNAKSIVGGLLINIPEFV